MWVDVVCLRKDGMKLSPETVRAAAPVRGFLTIDTVTRRPSGDDEAPLRCDIARLWLDRSSAGTPFGALEYVRVSRAGGTGLLIVGLESGNGSAHPQAWSCRVILGADEPVHSTTTDSDWRHTWPGSMPAPLADMPVLPRRDAVTPRQHPQPLS